jgi:hypothetical protein
MDENLDTKQQKMNESLAKLSALVKANTYQTKEGTVLRMPNFNDPEVRKIHLEAIQAAHGYFSSAKFYKHAKTYRFAKNKPD